ALLPVAKTRRRLIKATRRAYEILDRARGQKIASGHSLVDTEILGATNDAALAQSFDGTTIARKAHLGVTGDAADRLLALGGIAAHEQIGDAFLGEDVSDVVAIDHHRRQRHMRTLRQLPSIERLDKRGMHVLAKRFDKLHDELLSTRHGARTCTV